MNVIGLIHHIAGNNYLVLCSNGLGIIALDITLGRLLNTTINADLKLDRNGRFESGHTETSTHLFIIHPVKGRYGVLGRPHKKVSAFELY
jgi:hypothetical protein